MLPAPSPSRPPRKSRSPRYALATAIFLLPPWGAAGEVPAGSPTSKLGPKLPWSLAPVTAPAPPSVRDGAWASTSIDPFILARLESRGLQPSPAAERRPLLRRVTFDLTGLPPTPEETEAFLADPAPDAFAKVVERLLASPRYGEHWGRHWLDVVRYADTAGDTADYPLPEAWRYRNYVIDAFNADKPYDAFVREQIAGDIMARTGPPDRYAELVAATGFLALSRRFGFDSENYHHLTIQDTIDTLGQGVLGLTTGCARCHDHKFDPVSMRDYYALYGIFASTRYAFPGSEQKGRFRALVPLVPVAESQARWREMQSRFAALGMTPASVLRSLDDMDGDFETQRFASGGSNGVLVPPWLYEGKVSVTQAAQSPFRHLHPFGNVGASVAAEAGAYSIRQSLHPSRPNGLVHVNFEFRVAANDPAAGGSHRLTLGSLGAPPAVEAFLSREFLTLSGGSEPLVLPLPKPGEWHCLQLVLDLDSRTFGGCLGVPGNTTPFAARPFADGAGATIDGVALDARGAGNNRLPALDVDNVGVQDVPVPPVSATHGGTAAGEPSLAELRAELQALEDTADNPDTQAGATLPTGDSPPAPNGAPAVSGEVAPDREAAAEGGAGDPRAASQARIDDLRRRIDERAAAEQKLGIELEAQLAAGPVPLAYGVSEGTPHAARLQIRGEPDQPGAEVPRGFIEALGGAELPAGTVGSGRLELARWITRSDNPLAARVMVNRIWQSHFGNGLVKTPNDFGNRSEPPTHPELLDHLATEFIRSGWSVKAMHRLVLLSATWRQSSAAATSSPEAVELYAAFPRRRLGAEEIRDAILSVSGALDTEPGREHPFPPAHTWGFTQHNPFAAVYEHDKRSVYLMVQRLKRHPFLALFDGADPNASTSGRGVTTVPTQALYFLNDPLVHTKSLQAAARIQAASPDEAKQIELASSLALGRPPDALEAAEAAEFLAACRAELAASGAGDSATAALAAYVRTLFGSNEFLHCD